MILGKSYLGGTEIEKIYLGANVAYEAGVAGTEIYLDDNAASISDINSTGATTGNFRWSTVKSSINSIDTDSYDGTYSLELKATSAATSYAQYRFEVTNGVQYKVSFWYKVPVYGSQRFRALTGWVETGLTVSLTATVWTYFETTLTASETGVPSAFFYTGFPAAIDDTLFIDNMSILEL